jgi:hypothetical protein
VRAPAASEMLTLWELGATRHRLDRSALLCAWARRDLSADAIAELPLGVVTASLLSLREACFGTRIEGHIDCAACGERLELALTSSEMLQPLADGPQETEVHGIRVRAPSLSDLAAVATERNVNRAARQLLMRCAQAPSDMNLSELSEPIMRDVEDALEAFHPNADLALEVHCAACGKIGTAHLDPGILLWDEIDACARALLSEVHVLARAYGWTEHEILSLGPSRRAIYLSMVIG